MKEKSYFIGFYKQNKWQSWKSTRPYTTIYEVEDELDRYQKYTFVIKSIPLADEYYIPSEYKTT